MVTTHLEEGATTTTSPEHNVIGFANSTESCDAIKDMLTHLGIDSERIVIFGGPGGLELFQKMMEGCAWGEEAEKLMKASKLEFEFGHFVICMQAQERDEGLRLAEQAQALGGHGFRYFGDFADERLTA